MNKEISLKAVKHEQDKLITLIIKITTGINLNYCQFKVALLSTDALKISQFNTPLFFFIC